MPHWSNLAGGCATSSFVHVSYEASKRDTSVSDAVTLIVDGEVTDRRFVRLGAGKCTAGEMDVVRWTQYKHSPTDTRQTDSLTTSHISNPVLSEFFYLDIQQNNTTLERELIRKHVRKWLLEEKYFKQTTEGQHETLQRQCHHTDCSRYVVQQPRSPCDQQLTAVATWCSLPAEQNVHQAGTDNAEYNVYLSVSLVHKQESLKLSSFSITGSRRG